VDKKTMLCPELGIIRWPLEQPNAGITIRLSQSPPPDSLLLREGAHCNRRPAQHIPPYVLVQQCHPECGEQGSFSFTPSTPTCHHH